MERFSTEELFALQTGTASRETYEKAAADLKKPDSIVRQYLHASAEDAKSLFDPSTFDWSAMEAAAGRLGKAH